MCPAQSLIVDPHEEKYQWLRVRSELKREQDALENQLQVSDEQVRQLERDIEDFSPGLRAWFLRKRGRLEDKRARVQSSLDAARAAQSLIKTKIHELQSEIAQLEPTIAAGADFEPTSARGLLHKRLFHLAEAEALASQAQESGSKVLHHLRKASRAIQADLGAGTTTGIKYYHIAAADDEVTSLHPLLTQLHAQLDELHSFEVFVRLPTEMEAQTRFEAMAFRKLARQTGQIRGIMNWLQELSTLLSHDSSKTREELGEKEKPVEPVA